MKMGEVFTDEHEYLFLASIPALIIIPILFLILNSIKQSTSKKPGGSTLRSYPFLGTLPDFLKNRDRFLEWITEVLQETPTHTMVLRTPGQPDGIVTSDPLNVEYMLKTNFKNYPKGEFAHTLMKDFLGDGIFNSDGEHWNSQRKMASFEFNKRSLRNFVMENVQFEVLHRLIPVLDAAVGKGRVLDLQDVLQRLGFDNICKVAFDVDPDTLSEEGVGQNIPVNFMAAFDDSGKIVRDRFFDAADIIFWKVKKFLNIGSERRLKESMKVVNEFAFEIIRSRKSNPSSHSDDLLSRFAAKEDSTEEFVRDVIVNFLIAGRETTSSTLTWFFWLLSSNPGVELKVLEEVRSIKAKNPNPDDTGMFNFDQLREMNYLHAAISETLRLYPPVYVDTQTARNNDVMPDGTYVREGSFVSYCAYSMGRTESIWGSDCCEFKPERWLVDGVFQPESPFRFAAFHAGPRVCLGKEMAYIQMKSIVACMLDRYEYVVAKESPPEHVLSLTLQMKGGLPIKLKTRGGEYVYFIVLILLFSTLNFTISKCVFSISYYSKEQYSIYYVSIY